MQVNLILVLKVIIFINKPMHFYTFVHVQIAYPDFYLDLPLILLIINV